MTRDDSCDATMKKAIAEMTNEELAALHRIFNARMAKMGKLPWNADISDEAWQEAMERGDSEAIPNEVAAFIDGQTLVARLVCGIVRDRDEVDAADVIGFISGKGLEKNWEAATIAMREYGILLRDMGEIAPGQIVDVLLGFYQRLRFTFKEGGVKL